MRQSGEYFSYGPESIQPQRVDSHALDGCQDLSAVLLAVAVRVLPQLGVTVAVPRVLNAPAVTNVLQQSSGAGRRLVM